MSVLGPLQRTQFAQGVSPLSFAKAPVPKEIDRFFLSLVAIVNENIDKGIERHRRFQFVEHVEQGAACSFGVRSIDQLDHQLSGIWNTECEYCHSGSVSNAGKPRLPGEFFQVNTSR